MFYLDTAMIIYILIFFFIQHGNSLYLFMTYLDHRNLIALILPSIGTLLRLPIVILLLLTSPSRIQPSLLLPKFYQVIFMPYTSAKRQFKRFWLWWLGGCSKPSQLISSGFVKVRQRNVCSKLTPNFCAIESNTVPLRVSYSQRWNDHVMFIVKMCSLQIYRMRYNN